MDEDSYPNLDRLLSQHIIGPDTDEAEGVTADERFEFWTGWTRSLIAWMLGLTIVTVLSTLLPYGWARTVTFVGLAMLIVTPATFAWEAVQFVREHGRARS